MATLILLRGNSGSGKSTVARALQEHWGPGTLLIPQDTVRRDMLMVKDRPGNPTPALLATIARYGSERCAITIMEGILNAELYDSLFRALPVMFDNIHAYYFDVSFEETLRRHETRPQRHAFSPEAMRRWWVEHDFLTAIPEAIIPEASTLEETVAWIIAEVEGTI